MDEIDDENIIIIPRDSGTNDKDKLNLAIKEIISAGAKIIIGPMDSAFSTELEKYKIQFLFHFQIKNQKSPTIQLT